MYKLAVIFNTIIIVNQWIADAAVLNNETTRLIRKKRYFEKEFSDMCRHEIDVDVGIGKLTSPEHPDYYPSDSNCSWTLRAPIDQKIRIVISKLSIEESVDCSYDFLVVYDGSDNLGPVLGRYCGQKENVVLETTANAAFLEFASDANYEEIGFSLDYLLQAKSSCNFSLTIDSKGIVTSPNYPSNYPDNTDCYVHLTLADDTAQIFFSFPVMELEPSSTCEFDYVVVYDGVDTDSQIIDKQCQNSLARLKTSSGPDLLVHFHSDHLLNGHGFVLQYSVITSNFNSRTTPDNYGDCSWEIGQFNGTITSPGFPDNYEDGQECEFVLEAPLGYQIQLTVLFLDLQETDDHICQNDALQIRDGQDEEAEMLDELCGTLRREKVITSSKNYMYVFFSTDEELTFRGFKAEYHAISSIDAIRGSALSPLDCQDPSCDDALRPIVIQTQPQNITLHGGEWHSFSCTTENKNDVVMWFKDLYYLHAGEETIIGVEKLPNNTLVIKNMNWKLEGVYTCVILSASGTQSVSAWVSLDKTKNGKPDEECDIKFDNVPTPKAMLEGGIGFLQCSAINADATWWKNGLLLSSLPMPRVHVAVPGLILFHQSRKEDSGVYTCFAVHRTARCNATIDVMVEISPIPADSCGVPTLNGPDIEKPGKGRIVGGKDATPGSIPWQAMLYEVQAQAFCGGSLISPRWVVSAAHCIALFRKLYGRQLNMNELFVKLGKHDRLYSDREEIISGVENWIIHPNYNDNSFDNDIVLLKLNSRISYTGFTKPICLGTLHYLQTRAYNGFTMGSVSGWGELRYEGERPRYLQVLTLPIQTQTTCKASTTQTITDNMFCAGYAQETTADSCRGDSGGPFAVHIDQRWYLAGIVSWGEGCARPGKFGVYTKVGNYHQWIHDTMYAYEL